MDSCTPDQENCDIYLVICRHKISVNPSELGKVNIVFQILKNGNCFLFQKAEETKRLHIKLNRQNPCMHQDEYFCS